MAAAFPKTVLCVFGASGSGKTWLARAAAGIPGVHALDIDDVFVGEYRALRATPAGTRALAADAEAEVPGRRVANAVARKFRDEVARFRAGGGRVLVVVGTKFPQPPGAHSVSIEIADLPATYVRYVRREIRKAADTLPAAERRVAAAPAGGPELACLADDLAHLDTQLLSWPPPSAREYAKQCRAAAEDHLLRGARPMPQAAILDLIRSLATDPGAARALRAQPPAQSSARSQSRTRSQSQPRSRSRAAARAPARKRAPR